MGISPVPTRSIDFLRGIAALYVVINHTRGAFFAGGSAVLENGGATFFDKAAVAALQLTSLGQEFVVLFFVLSGFAISHSVSNSKSLNRFYQKRAIRVWIPYLAATVFATTLCWAVVSWSPLYPRTKTCLLELCTASGFLKVASYIDPQTSLTPQFWSLPYEILFYAIAPFILVNGRRVLIGLSIASFVTLASLIIYGIDFNPTPSLIANFAINELLYFEVGASAYYYFRFIPMVSGKKLLFLILGTFILITSIKLWYGASNIPSNIIMAIVTAFVIKGIPDRLGNSMWNLGYMSYSLYIFHYAVIVAIGAILFEGFGISQAGITSYVGWAAALPIIFVVCWLMWLISERPTTAWLDKKRNSELQARSTAIPV